MVFRAGLRAVVAGVLILLAVPLLPVTPASAQAIMSGGTIDEIVVRGTQRIEPTTVRSYLTVDPGDRFDPAALNESLKNLFNTGLFADVTLRREDGRLIVNVVENPIINRIAFEGNDELEDESLRNEVELRPRVVYTRTKVQNDVKRLLEVYRRNGRFGATVEPKVIQLEQNRVDLVFEIDEGPETEVRAINFVGNKAFSDGSLRSEVATSEAAWWRFLNPNDTYDPDRMAFDRELLRRFYLSEGYADFQVESAVAELTPDRDAFILTFTVSEGERYTFGDIGIETTLKNLDPEELRNQLTTEKGDWYDASEVDESIDNLTEAVGNLGYAFVDVKPRVDRNREENIINLTYDIQEGPKVFIERIDISGNVRTLDRVIRREFRVVEGDAFNASKIRRSRERVQNLGFFKTVQVENEQGSEPDKTIVNVNVEEQSTGSLSFGAGFSTDSGPLGSIQLRERNLLGKGQDLRLDFSLSAERQQIDLGFTEPYFLGRDLAAGFDLFRTETNQDELTFDEKRTGGALRAGYQVIEHWRQSWKYEFSRREITDVDGDAAVAIKQEEGTTDRSAVSHTLRYDTRDSRFDPRKGMTAFISNTFAGIGGDVTWIKNIAGADYYYPLSDNWTVRVGAEAGQITGIGEDTRVLDRFFVGGSQIRGFRTAGVGPRDKATDDPLGAKQYYTSTLELRFPLPLPDEFPIRGRFFTDVGAAWGVDNVPGEVLDESSPRLSVGTGASWRSPLGPINVDLGFPVVKEDFDEEEIFRFSFGTRF
ncbi:outer membrane protein assembly factor BamA [Ferruginivarius sediminum]|nr:outer membrane protein assembly factor BamA [Ferruginivarius sediminum]